ncbi:MAG TPA: hypothetical protein VGP82_07670 [Ktedonobacterales bacterium]|jgi:hypothetical protein|nr:hypothetical protein [Ktedonobacterales bacterium]
MSPLTTWETYYVIVGSSAGALTGLLFVVVTLVAGSPRRGAGWGAGAFTTPTVVQFGMVLGVVVLLSAPWSSLAPPALLLGLTGLGGVAYTSIVVRRLGHRIGYEPVAEDWLCYAILPFVAYAALLVAALFLPGSPEPALFGIGAALLVLLFDGIHNAWDLATYIAVMFPHQSNEPDQPDGKRDPREATME